MDKEMTRMQGSKLALTAVALAPLLALAACGSDKSKDNGSGTAGTQSFGGAPGSNGGANANPTAGGGNAGSGAPASAGAASSGGSASSNGGANASAGDTGGGIAIGTCPYTPPQDPATLPKGWTRGEVTVFNENGGWTWYNDERVVVDTAAGKIVVSSAESKASDQAASPNIDVVIYDLATKQSTKKILGKLPYSDDHNNGGIVVTAPGEYFVAYAHHNKECNSYWAKYSGGMWSNTETHAWADQGCPWGMNKDMYVTYNNLWKLSSEGRIYNIIRSVETSPTFLYSEDDGVTWKFGGRLTGSKQLGYNAGYYKYWGNGVDRIDFFATESHPRDSDTSLYHGYIKDKKVYDSKGKEIDSNLYDQTANTIQEYTPVFKAGTSLGGVTLHRLWNFDLARYADGTIGVLWQGREIEPGSDDCKDKDHCNPGHHMAYSRFDGTEWKSTRLVKGGRTLYRDHSGWWEEDYLGGGALDPDDPHVIYISTNIDPRDDKTEYPVNEIWKGVTCDNGASFVWVPMTMNSEHENLRPAVPKWDAQNTALFWFRGTYQTAQTYDAQVVGIIGKR